LPLFTPAVDPASDKVGLASVPSAAWYIALPDVKGNKPQRQRFKRYSIGFFHIDIAEVQTAEGKLYLFVATDWTSKYAVTQLVDKANRKTAWEFLEHLVESVPYRIHTILTDNGIQFAEQPRNRNTIYSRPMS
jgi:IS30 family transposase